MAETYALDVQDRHVTGKQVRQLRRDNLIPAVVYGAGGESLTIACPRRPLEILLTRASGTHVISLNVDGKLENVLVRDVQRHAIRRELVHVDFLRVDLTKKLRAEVPLVLTGEPKLSADLTMAHYMTQIEVECLPASIPDHIEVSLAHLVRAGDQVTVGDLAAIADVTFVADPHDVIARLELATGAQTAADDAADAALAAEPEIVSTKGKKEEDEVK